MYNGFEVINSHCHIYPDKIAQKASDAISDFYDLPHGYDGTVKTLLDVETKAGVDRFLVQSVATTPKQVKRINEFIASTVSEHKGVMYGLGTVHPESENIEGDVEHLLSLGLLGVKLHPDVQKFKLDDYRCLKIYELCEKNKLPILLHTGDSRYDFSNPNRLVPILNIFTDLTVIGAHFGAYSVWEESVDILSKIPNLYVDCSSSFPFIKPDFAKMLINKFGTDKILFGTDYPLGDINFELNYISSLQLNKIDYEKIFSVNCKKVFGF